MLDVNHENVRRTGKTVQTCMEGKTWGVIAMSNCGNYLFINHKVSPKAEPVVKMIKRSDYMMRDRLSLILIFSDKTEDHKPERIRQLRGLWITLYEAIQDKVVMIDKIPDICRDHLSTFQTHQWLVRDGDKYQVTYDGKKMYTEIIEFGKHYSQ